MKLKKGGVLFLVLILVLPTILAVEFNVNEEYDQGETLLTKISGNFVTPLSKLNIYFYRGHVRVPMEYDLTKIEGEYYFYALLPETSANYSVIIKDVQYYSGSNIISDEIQRNFTITEDMADFSINPGFIITNTDFSLRVQSLQESKITLEITGIEDEGSWFGGGSESIDLISGEIRDINFELGTVSRPIFETFKLSTTDLEYQIPVYIFGENIFCGDGLCNGNENCTTCEEDCGVCLNETSQINQTQENETKENKTISSVDMGFDPDEIEILIDVNSDRKKVVYLENFGDILIGNITLSFSKLLDEYISISEYEINELESESQIKIDLEIISSGNEEIIEGYLKAESSIVSTKLDIILAFVEDYVPSDEEEDVPSVSLTCAESSGIICEDEEECSGKSVYARDGKCCLEKCESKSNGSTRKIIGWTILIAVVLGLAWFFLLKFKGTKKKVDLLKSRKSKRRLV
jgi:hypothetical protein